MDEKLIKLIQDLNNVLEYIYSRLNQTDSNLRVLADAHNLVIGNNKVEFSKHEERIDLLEKVRRTYDGSGKFNLSNTKEAPDAN